MNPLNRVVAYDIQVITFWRVALREEAQEVVSKHYTVQVAETFGIRQTKILANAPGLKGIVVTLPLEVVE